MVQNLCGNQNALTSIEGVVNDRVACLHQFGHTARRCIQRVRLGNFVGSIMRQLEEGIGYRIVQLGGKRAMHLVFTLLRSLVEVRFANNIGHACFDDLQPVVFQIQLHIVVCTGMEIQEVLAHDQHGGARLASVVFYGKHRSNSFFEAFLHAPDTALAQAAYNGIDRFIECCIGAARFQLVGTYLAQQLFQRVDHGQAECNLHSGF